MIEREICYCAECLKGRAGEEEKVVFNPLTAWFGKEWKRRFMALKKLRESKKVAGK